MIRFVVLPLVFLITFLLVINNKERWALYLCLFLLPMDSQFAVKQFGVNIAAVLGLLLGTKIRQIVTKKRNVARLPYRKYLLLILISFIISVIVFLLKQNYSDVTEIYNRNIKSTFFIFVPWYLLSIWFFKFFYDHINDVSQIYNSFVALLLSMSYYILTWLNFKFGIWVPEFLKPALDWDPAGADRFSGFTDYELNAEFLFIVSVFSILILLSKERPKLHKLIAFVTLMISFPMNITTGTRSVIVMSLIFIVSVFMLFMLMSSMKATKKMMYVIIIIVLLIFAYQGLLQNSFLMERIEKTMITARQVDYSDLYVVQKLFNRDWLDTYQDVIDVGGLFGIGPVLVSSVRGDRMVYHCLYYNIIVVFGIFGMIAYALFWGRLGGELFIKIRTQRNDIYVFIFSLYTTLLIDQLKINYFRNFFHIMLFWLLFALLAILNRKSINIRE